MGKTESKEPEVVNINNNDSVTKNGNEPKEIILISCVVNIIIECIKYAYKRHRINLLKRINNNNNNNINNEI